MAAASDVERLLGGHCVQIPIPWWALNIPAGQATKGKKRHFFLNQDYIAHTQKIKLALIPKIVEKWHYHSFNVAFTPLISIKFMRKCVESRQRDN